MRKFFVAAWLVVLASAIAALFWYNELQYQLPTPVPAGYQQITQGTYVKLPRTVRAYGERPLFLHFFNPDCPCSRFNITMFKSLVKQYQDKVDFKVVVMSRKQFTAEQVRQKFGIKIPVIFDQQIAMRCGVYSTPQAVVLDAQSRLYYRGNYNRSRYCTDEKSNYARMAIDGSLRSRNIVFDHYALTSYGCRLPNCTN
jgi:hypothetical protein